MFRQLLTLIKGMENNIKDLTTILFAMLRQFLMFV